MRRSGVRCTPNSTEIERFGGLCSDRVRLGHEREVEDAADARGQLVSVTRKRDEEGAGALPCWACLPIRPRLARWATGKEKELGLRLGPADEEAGQMDDCGLGQKLREEGGSGKIPFLFSKHIFKTKFKSSLNSFVVFDRTQSSQK
jgi:hypothetical protein